MPRGDALASVSLTSAPATAAPLISCTAPEMLAEASAVGDRVFTVCAPDCGRSFSGRLSLLGGSTTGEDASPEPSVGEDVLPTSCAKMLRGCDESRRVTTRIVPDKHRNLRRLEVILLQAGSLSV